MKVSRIRGNLLLPVLLVCMLFLLASCGSPQDPEEENVLIYAALNPVTRELESEVERFNRTHGTKMVIHDYSDEGGAERLKTELVLGQVPDIMEMQRLGRQDFRLIRRAEVLWFYTPFDADLSNSFWMPYRQMVQRGYLEDLWPYIDNDPQYYREKILEAPSESHGGGRRPLYDTEVCVRKHPGGPCERSRGPDRLDAGGADGGVFHHAVRLQAPAA